MDNPSPLLLYEVTDELSTVSDQVGTSMPPTSCRKSSIPQKFHENSAARTGIRTKKKARGDQKAGGYSGYDRVRRTSAKHFAEVCALSAKNFSPRSGRDASWFCSVSA